VSRLIFRPKKGGPDGNAGWRRNGSIMASHGNRKSAPEGIPRSYKPQPNAPKVQTNKANEGSNKAFQQHDEDNREGSFERTGNHARTGNRGHQ
jgi:hypothetical protein